MILHFARRVSPRCPLPSGELSRTAHGWLPALGPIARASPDVISPGGGTVGRLPSIGDFPGPPEGRPRRPLDSRSNSIGRRGMDPGRILATYRIETAAPPEQAAAVMAGEQSTGTFVRVPGETDDLRERFGARVERVVELESVLSPSLPGARAPGASDGPARHR